MGCAGIGCADLGTITKATATATPTTERSRHPLPFLEWSRSAQGATGCTDGYRVTQDAE